jgi:hypothetical protein
VDLQEFIRPSVLASFVHSTMEESEMSKTNLAPALSAEEIRAEVAQFGIDERELRVLFHRKTFSTLAYKSHQFGFLDKYAHDPLHCTFCLQKLAVLFHMNVRTIRRNFLQGPQKSEPLGRHTAIDEGCEADLIATVLEAFRVGHAMGRKRLLQLAREPYEDDLTRGWANAFIGAISTFGKLADLSSKRTRDWRS